MVAVSVIALLVALVALAVAIPESGLIPGRSPSKSVDGVPPEVLALRQEVAALRAEAGSVLRHLSVVRYDAFGDQGGGLSWSLALLDDAGDGVVISSIHGRSDARTYAKSISHWSCEQQLSPEEEQAIVGARP